MFEHSLIDLEAKTQPRRRRWISLPLAIGLHLVGLTAFAFASYWNVGPVTEPNSLNVAFFDVTLPPPAIQRGGGAPRPTPVPRPQPVPRAPETVRQPDLENMPEKAPEPGTLESTQESTAPGTDPTAPPGPGDPNGDPESHSEVGDIHGTTDPVPPVFESGPVYLTPEMSRPVPLQPIQPRYTEPARRAGVQGTVVVEAIIDEKGRATNVRVLRGLPMGLDRAAMEAIQQVTFKPAMRGSRPVKVYFNLTVNFTIQR